MGIKILRQGLPILGYLKIGANYPKNVKRGAPYRFDHIEVTGRERDDDDNLIPNLETMQALVDQGLPTCGGCARSKKLGFPDGLPTKVGIFIQHNDLELAFPNRLAWYQGRSNICHGDGETAMRRAPSTKQKVRGKEVTILGDFAPHGPCGPACPQFQDRSCKPNGKLRFSLAADLRIGGSMEFKTTSWASIANIEASLKDIKQTTGGLVAWIALWFEIVEEHVQPKDGSAPQKAFIVRVSPAVKGGPEALIAQATEVLRVRGDFVQEMRQLEATIDRRAVWDETDEDAGAIVGEFYSPPGEAAGEDTAAQASEGAETSARPGSSDGDRSPPPQEGADEFATDQEIEILTAKSYAQAEMHERESEAFDGTINYESRDAHAGAIRKAAKHVLGLDDAGNKIPSAAVASMMRAVGSAVINADGKVEIPDGGAF